MCDVILSDSGDELLIEMSEKRHTTSTNHHQFAQKNIQNRLRPSHAD